MDNLFRLPPKLPVASVQTYAIARPAETHTRPATCAEVECPAYLNGWTTRVPKGSVQADYIKNASGRVFSSYDESDGTIAFVFFAGQRCFASDSHRIDLERPATFAKFGGDYRGRTTDVIIMNSDDWSDDFANHQQRLSDAQG